MADNQRTCILRDCNNPFLAKNLCGSHYSLWRTRGIFHIPPIFPKDLCSIPGCGIGSKTKGFCGAHYARSRTPGASMEAARRNHKSPIVDGRKRCGICKQWKLCDEFTKHPHGTGGIKSVCRICSAAKARAYAAANPNYQNEWRAKNPDSSRDNVQFRRAKRMDVDAELIDRREVFERDGNVCQLCDAPMDMSQKAPHPLAPSIDHVLAISRGGTHTMDNIQSAHFYCNSSKGDRDAPLTKPPLAA